MKMGILKLTVIHSKLLKIPILFARRFILKNFPDPEPSVSLLIAVYEQRQSLQEVFSLSEEPFFLV